MKSRFRVGGLMTMECYDPRTKKVLWVSPLNPNGVPTVMLNHIPNIIYGAGMQIPQWYFGLVASSGFSTFNASDTMGSHIGWSEQTGYDEAARQSYTPGAASGGVITNPVVATFTATGSMGVQGAFLVSVSTKGGSTGTLGMTSALNNAPQTIPAGLTVRLKYDLTFAAA